MPIAVPQLGSYQYVPETKEDLDWADLATVDLSLFGNPESNKQLANTLIHAVREKGLFYVKNFNISEERVNKLFAIGREFYELPLEEKSKYTPEGLGAGQSHGYIPAGRRILDEKSGLASRVEIYNIPKFNGAFSHNHPAVIADHIIEIEEFARSLHSEVLDPLHVLLATALELPEDYFTSRHKYEVTSEDQLRYMKYSKYTPEENAKIGNIWVPGHTDIGSWTLLFRQPVAALQIRDATTNEWKWVKPQDGTLTVNACDALSLLTAEYVKSTIHRVVSPPKDQQHVDRLGLFYFSRPHNDLPLATIKESPVLQREGCVQNTFEATGNEIPTMKTWTTAKQKWVYNTMEHQTATLLPGWKEKAYA